MIKECTEILAKNLEKNPDFISNNYSLYDVGDYIIIKKDGTIQSIKFNKNIDLNKDDLLYRKICQPLEILWVKSASHSFLSMEIITVPRISPLSEL